MKEVMTGSGAVHKRAGIGVRKPSLRCRLQTAGFFKAQPNGIGCIGNAGTRRTLRN